VYCYLLVFLQILIVGALQVLDHEEQRVLPFFGWQLNERVKNHAINRLLYLWFLFGLGASVICFFVAGVPLFSVSHDAFYLAFKRL